MKLVARKKDFIERRVKAYEAQRILGVGRNKVFALAKEGKILSELVGHTRLFYLSSLQDYLEKRKKQIRLRKFGQS